MAINVSQAFKRTSKNPIDETFALTKAQMLTVNDNLMPDYYFTVCQDDGCFYLYDKSATASQTTGKFAKFEGGTDSLAFGYLNETNGKFYKESTYTTEIAGNTGKLYITLDTNYIYRYDATNGFVQVGGGSTGGSVEGYLNPTNGKFYADSTYTTEITGESGKLYVTLDTNKVYRYDSTNGFVLVGGEGETIQYDTMPTASSALVGKIIQYVGSTTATYTKGYWYECVLDGSTYKWQNIQVQEGGGESGSGISVTATLLAASWDAQNQQTVTFTGYQSSMNGVIGVPASATDAQKEAYASALVRTVAQNGNQFTFECESIPSIDLPVTIYAGGSTGGSGVPVGGTTNQALLKNSNTDGDTKWANVVMPGDIAPTESTSTSSKAYAVGDFLYYEGVLYKVTSAIAQGGSIVTSGSGQNVEVDTVSGELGEIQNQIDVVRDNGAVNKYKCNIASKTVSNIPFTVNSDDTITAGTGTASAVIALQISAPITLKAGKRYAFAGPPSGSSSTTYNMRAINTANGTAILLIYDTTAYFTPNADITIVLDIVIRNGVVISSPIVFKPMVYDADLGADVPYQSHAETNVALTQKVAGLQETGCVNYYKVTTQSQVKSGLTFTVADNGIIGISGTISESNQLDLNNSSDNSVNLPLGVPLKFIAMGFAGSNDYLFATLNATVNGSLQRIAKDYNGNGAIFTLDPNKTYSNFYVRFAYYTQYGSIPSGAKLFPMITPDLSATYADYQPYSMTNRELTEAVASGSTTVSSSYTYAPLFFQKYGGVKQVNIQGLINLPADTATVLCNLPDGYGILFDGKPTDFWVSNGVKIRIAFSKGSNNITARPYGTAISDSNIDLLITYI